MGLNKLVDARDQRYVLFEMLNIDKLSDEKHFSEFDRETYEATLELAEQIAVSQSPMMFIYYDEDYRLIQSYVHGYALDPMHRVNFRHLWLDK